MNINSKAFAARRLTKRQRKAARGDNAAAALSRKMGQRIGKYIGRHPEYQGLSKSPTDPVTWFKAEKGIPFVRA